ncbi:hypothetical protein V1L52_08000 [Treponema sp. HNW]|uniref:hypothetical protein n=1 Tax=Treponema sp. HNW TaxID=3116654 RepID=UPI003D1408F3
MEPRRLFIIGILIFIILASVSFLISFGKKKDFSAPPREYSINEEPFLPPEPELKDEYIYANELKPRWSREDCEPYFTFPDAKQLEQLKDSNDVLIKRILESAP